MSIFHNSLPVLSLTGVEKDYLDWNGDRFRRWAESFGHDWKVDENGNHYCSMEGCTEHSGHVPVFSSSGTLCNCDCHEAEDNTHSLFHCSVCNQNYVASEPETITENIGGGFSIQFKKDRIVCANLCFKDMGDYGLVWVEETPGSAATSIEATARCVVNGKLSGDTYPAERM